MTLRADRTVSTMRRPRRLAAALGSLCAVALVASVAPSSTAQADDARVDRPATQSKLDAYAKAGGPGTTVAAGNATESWHLSKGTGHVWNNKPIQPNEHFRAASQTKVFNAAVVLQLVDEGKVGLDDPIEKYLPGLVQGNGYDGSKITIRQLLQHTSGIPSYGAPKTEPDGTYTPESLVRHALSKKPLFAPGTQWSYSNTGFVLAELVVKKVTGQSIGDAITSRIIQPLGLKETRFPKPGDKTIGAPAVRGYSWVLVGWLEVSNQVEPSWASGAGALISTLGDLMTFHRALLGGKVVSAAGLAEMRKVDPGGVYDGYGLGLMRLNLSCGGQAWGHAGDLNGYSSLTMATDDGRHASIVTNKFVDAKLKVNRENVIDAALCESKD